jgi:hypothetical protein
VRKTLAVALSIIVLSGEAPVGAVSSAGVGRGAHWVRPAALAAVAGAPGLLSAPSTSVDPLRLALVAPVAAPRVESLRASEPAGAVRVHGAGISPETQTSAELSRKLEETARALDDRAINGAAYASEADFLADFSQVARAAFKPRNGLSPETRLLFALEGRNSRDSALFNKNMAIVADVLYSSLGPKTGAQERQALAGLRGRFGVASVRALDRVAPAPPSASKPVKGLWAARLVPGPLGGALREAFEFISARDLSLAAFPSVIERWARDHRLRARLVEFEARLVALNDGFETASETSVWRIALEINDGDARDAIDMLGAIVGQRKVPLRYVEKILIAAHPDAKGSEDAFVRAARSYYLLGEIHEKGLAHFGRSNLYPDGSSAAGQKFWHYYGAAAVAVRLHHRPAWAAAAAGVLIGAAYEAATFPNNVSLLRSRGMLKSLVMNISDSGRDVVAHAQGNDFGRRLLAGASLATVPIVVSGPALEWARRARVYALNAWWQFWWYAGPRVANLWRDYGARLKAAAAVGRKPSVRDPKGLFIASRLLGLSVDAGSMAKKAASDQAVLIESRGLFLRHINAGSEAQAAFDRFLNRAVLHNPSKSGTKLRSLIAYYLRESSVLPAEELAAYYDGLLIDEGALIKTRAESARVLADFTELSDRLILNANRDVLPGERILGVLIAGSYANGSPRPGSDLDFQIITENGSAPAADLLVEFGNEWTKLHPAISLEVFSNEFLPPDRRLIESLIPEAYLIVSPYPESAALLARRGPVPAQVSTSVRVGAATRFTGAVLRGWFRVVLAARDLADS